MSAPGRARGRARGRAQPTQQAPRPVGAPTPQAAPAPAPPRPQQPTTAAQSSGDGLATAMQQKMRIGNGGNAAEAAGGDRGADRGRRRGIDRYIECHTRPDHVTDADKRGSTPNTTLLTNHVELSMNTGLMFFHHHVSFVPDILRKSWRKELVAACDDIVGPQNTYLFEGMALFHTRRLTNDGNTTREAVKTHPNGSGEQVRVIFKLVAELHKSDPTIVQLYNSLMRQAMRDMGYEEILRQYYDMNDCMKTPLKFDVAPGFQTSILNYDGGPLLQLDVSHKLVRQDSAFDVMQECFRRDQMTFKEETRRQLMGAIVMTGYNNKTYRVQDVDFNKRPTSTFKLKDDTEMTYIEYYKKKYGVEIRDHSQFLIVCKEKGNKMRSAEERFIDLVPELCKMTGLTEAQQADNMLKRQLGEFTRPTPVTRIEKMKTFLRKLNDHPRASQRFRTLEFAMDNKCLEVAACKMPPETIVMKGRRGVEPVYCKENQRSHTDRNGRISASWDNALKNYGLLSAVTLTNWIFIYPSRSQQLAAEICQALTNVTQRLGCRFEEPYTVPVRDGRRATEYQQALRESVSKDTQMVVILMDGQKKDIYDMVKKYCILENPVPSQCLVTNTAQRLQKKGQLASYATKVGLQMEVKLGADAWAVQAPFERMTDLMVVGMDTYHDSQKKNMSVSGFIFSLNSRLTQYYSQACHQQRGDEISCHFQLCFKGGLSAFRRKNGHLPTKIVVYRDGVGDSQLKDVYELEVNKLLEVLEQLYRSQNLARPTLVFVVVKKRINTRFFAKNSRGEIVNPEPGHVVDRRVTRPEWWDFFLVSQAVNQGTVSPTHFNVIYDTLGWKLDRIQRFSYIMTHLYYNWPGTVRVPAPCQYAHKLAFLVGDSLHQTPTDALAEKLYYL